MAGTQQVKPSGQVTGARVEVKPHWGGGTEIEPIFVDQLHILRIENQFYLTFGQTRFPIVEGPGGTIDAEIKAVVKMVIPKEALQRIVSLLAMNAESEKGAEG